MLTRWTCVSMQQSQHGSGFRSRQRRGSSSSFKQLGSTGLGQSLPCTKNDPAVLLTTKLFDGSLEAPVPCLSKGRMLGYLVIRAPELCIAHSSRMAEAAIRPSPATTHSDPSGLLRYTGHRSWTTNFRSLFLRAPLNKLTVASDTKDANRTAGLATCSRFGFPVFCAVGQHSLSRCTNQYADTNAMDVRMVAAL